MALRGAATRLLSNSQKCAAVTLSRAQGTAATAHKGTFDTPDSLCKYTERMLSVKQ